MIKIKSVLIAASLIMGLALPATAQIGEPRQNFSVGFNGCQLKQCFIYS